MANKEVAALLSEARSSMEADPAKALDAAKKAEAAAKAAGDKALEVDSLCLIVLAMIANGTADEALKLAEEWQASAQMAGDAAKDLAAQLALAEAHLAVGDPDAALKTAKKARKAADQLSDLKAEAKAALAEGQALTNAGKSQEGVEALTEALSLCQKSRDKIAEAQAWLAMAGARQMSRAHDEDVVAALRKALAIYRDLGERSQEAVVLNKIGEAQLNAKPQEALLMAKESMAILRDLGLTQGEAQALHTIVKAHAAREEPQDGLRVVKDRLATATGRATVLFTPAAVTAYLNSGDPEKAMSAATDALETAQDLGDRKQEGWMLYSMVEVHLAKEEIEDALSKAQEALEAFLEVGDKLGEASAQAALTAAYTMNNQAHKAPHRMAGMEQLGRLVEAITGRNKALFFDAFEKLNSSMGVDQHDFDAVLKPIFKRDSKAEDFYKESSYEFYGLVYEKDNKDHLKKAKNIDRLEMFLGQRFGSMGYGPSFRSIHQTWRKGDVYTIGSGSHALSVIQDMTKDTWEETAMWQAHPGMMDAALQVQGIPHNPA